MLGPTVKIRNKGIQSGGWERAQNGRDVQIETRVVQISPERAVSSLKASAPETGEKCTLMSVIYVAGFGQYTFLYLCSFHPFNLISPHFTNKETESKETKPAGDQIKM